MFAKKVQWPLAGVALLVMLGGVALGAGAYAGSAKPTAVAVVNVKKVFNSLKERTQIEAQMRGESQKLGDREKAKKKNIQGLQQDLQVLTPGSAAYQSKRDALQKAQIEFQTWGRFKQQQLAHERAIQVERLYKKTLGAVGRVAKSGGYDVVLFKESKVDFSHANPKQLDSLIQVRKVLWSKDGLNITDQVIQRMNNEYENQS